MTGIYGVPRRPPGLIHREALLQEISNRPRLVVVRAPGGSGKTSLLSDWAANGGADGLWVTVNDEAGSGTAFWTVMIDTFLDHWQSSWRDGLHPGFRLSQQGTGAMREILGAAGARPVTLVIDDADHIAEPSVHEELILLLEEFPTLSVILASRLVTALETLAAGAGHAMLVLDGDQLQLTDDEARAILSEEGFPATEAAAAEAAEIVGRSMLSLRYLLMGMRENLERNPKRIEKTAFEAAIPFLVRARVGSDLGGAALSEFLARTSLADDLTAELARVLGGRDDAGELLDRAAAEGFGGWSTGPRGTPVFRYAPALRRGFRDHLELRHREQVPALRTLLASWAETQRLPVVSLTHKLLGGDLDGAARLVLDQWRELLNDHEDVVADLLKDIPSSDLRRYPVLAMLLGTIYNAKAINRSKAVGLFAIVAESSVPYSVTLTRPQRATFLTMESAALRLSGEVERAVVVAERAGDELGRLQPEEELVIEGQYASLLNQLGLTFLYGGRSDEALRLFRQALARLDAAKTQDARPGELGPWSTELHSLALLSGTLAMLGEITAARVVVEKIEGVTWPAGATDGYLGVTYHLARAFIALERFDFDEAARHVDAVRPFVGTIEHWGLILHLDSIVSLGRDQAARSVMAMEGFVRRQSQRGERSPFTATRLANTRSLLFLAAGKPAAAIAVLDRMRGAASEPVRSVARARIALVSGDAELVERLLESMVESQAGPLRIRAEALLLLTTAVLRTGDEERALALLERAALILDESGLRSPLMFVPPAGLAAIRSLALGRGSERTRRVTDDTAVPAILPERATVIAPLTPRERVVLRELSRSSRASDIAAALFVSPNTVKSQLRGLYRKLGVSSRDEALLLAVTLGLLVAPFD